jgi:PAS domain S-box-containing protein
MYRVLVMSREPAGIADSLSGCEIVQVKSDLEILLMLGRDSNFDLILGDVGIPDSLANLRRKYPNIPVMILANKPDVSAAFQAAQLGAVDYVPASLDAEALSSRVEQAIRQATAVPPATEDSPLTPANRPHLDDNAPRFLSVRELLIDRHRRKARFRKQPIKLTRTEFDILAYLVENKGRVVTFEELVFVLTGIYPKHEEARRRLSAHVTYLREALSKASCDGYIVSVRGRGYVIEWDVEEKLRRTETRLEFLLQQIPAVIWTTSKDGQITWISGAGLADLNLTPDDLIGTVGKNLLQTDSSIERARDQATRLALEGQKAGYEGQLLDTTFEVRLEPLRDDQGNIEGTIGIGLNITERKRAEEALRESEERYRIISGMMSDYVYAARVLPGDNYNTQVEWVAGALTKITGFTEQEVKEGMRWDRLVHPDDWHIVEDRRKRLLNGEQVECEFRMTGKHGQSYWVRTYTYPVCDDQERRVVGLFAAVKDITEWKETEAALVRERNLLHTILEAAPIQIYAKDLNSRFILANRMVWQLHNLSGSEDVVGKTDRDIFGDAARNDQEAEAQLFDTGQPIINEERFTPAELGGPRWSLVTKVPLYDADHKVIGLVGVNRDITELKQSMEAVRQNEANLREIIEGAPTPVLIYQGTKVVFANAAIEALTGYSRDEWLTMNFYDVLPAGIRERAIEQAIRRQRGEPVEARRELKLIHKNGDERWVNYMATVIQYEGQPAVLSIVADLTHQKTVETALREQEAALRSLIAKTPAPMLIFQGEMMRFVNPAAEKLVGYTLDEMMSMAFWDIIHPDMRSFIRDRGMRRQAGEAVPQRYEVKLVTKTGEVRWVDYMGTLIEYEGQPAALGIVFDITDRKQTEAALRESEREFRVVLENIPLSVDAFDEQNRIVFWNRECERVTGYSAEEILNHPDPLSLLYPDRDYLAEHLAEWGRRGDNFRDWEWQLTTKDGRIKTIAWSNISTQFPIPGWKTWGIGVDVTARREAERALRETEEALRHAVAKAPIYLWVINREGKITLSEGKALAGLGYRPGETVGKSIFDINRSNPELLFQVQRALDGEYSSAWMPVRGRFFDTRHIPMLDDEGGVAGVMGIWLDVTGKYPSTGGAS